jgi:kynureninase
MDFQNNADYARSLDVQDELSSWKDHFLFPQYNGEPVLYFTGNSLGLQPKGVKDALIQECNDWEKYGVEGHIHATNPWYSYHERFTEGASCLVGALANEVVVMNQLTVNLQLLLISFYRPAGKRIKILFENKPFPSDVYAFESQARIHGLKPEDVLVELQPRQGEWNLRTEDIISKIEELGDTLATVCIGAVNYFTGQFFDLKKITEAAHKVGAIAGFDLAHTAGNLPLKLHDWQVDFACWCSYKYLNSGPGGVAGAFVHEKHVNNHSIPRLAGWWGHNKSSRFQMLPGFDPIPGAESWQLSNAPVFSMAAHKVALDMFTEVGMEKLRKKSILLTAYLEFILKEIQENTSQRLVVITPSNAEERGAQLSVIVEGRDRSIIGELASQGVVADWREPNVIRLAPVPFYNSFEDIFRFGKIFSSILKK